MGKPDKSVKRPKKKGDPEVTEPELDFEYYKDVPVKARMIPSEGKNIVEFTPPEPETNICPLCNDTIPDDTLRSPNFLCEQCKRPIACTSCKEEILEPVGITECPWCHTDTKSTEKIKHALRVRKEKKTYEEEFTERAKFMTEYATAKTNQFLNFPEYGEGTPYSTLSHAIGGVRDQDSIIPDSNAVGPINPSVKPWDPTYDRYPHRDNDDLMKPKEGWGAPFDIPRGVSTGKWGDDLMIAEEAQRGTGRSTQRRLSAMNHLYHWESSRLYMDRRVLFIVDNMQMVKNTMRALEELFMKRFNLGSGAFETLFTKKGKIIDVVTRQSIPPGKHYTLVVLDLTTPMPKSEVRRFKMNISAFMCPIIGGESIVETEEDPEPEPGREAEDFVVEEPGFTPKLVLDGDEIQVTKSNVTYKRDVTPVYGFGSRSPQHFTSGPAKVEGTFEGVVEPKAIKRRSRVEKPPRTALRCFKCGNKPDECTCNGPSIWQRIKRNKGNPPKRARHPFGGMSALPKKREWAKPSQSLTTVITTGGSWDWGWILMSMAVTIFFIVILLAMLSWAVK